MTSGRNPQLAPQAVLEAIFAGLELTERIGDQDADIKVSLDEDYTNIVVEVTTGPFESSVSVAYRYRIEFDGVVEDW